MSIFTLRMSKQQIGVICFSLSLVVVLGLVAGFAWWQQTHRRDAAARVRGIEREGKVLVAVDPTPPAGRAGQTVRLVPADLTNCQLFLRGDGDDPAWMHVKADATVESREGVVTTVRQALELLLVPSGIALFVDDSAILPEAGRWDAFWIMAGASPSAPVPAVIPRLEVRDGFEREELTMHPYARITAGTVRLAQHGGGMPDNAAEEADFNFQRAVNPFSIHLSEGGRLTYRVHAPERWGDCHVEASAYFGVPKTGHVVDRESLPTNTDLLVVMGPEDGMQVAFGWSGEAGCFVLQSRSGDGPWTVLERWRESRPPLTNWVSIGLDCRQGRRIRGLLDGVAVLSADLPQRLRGPFHVQGGTGLAEFDDVRGWSLPAPPRDPVPLMIRSRHFAGKRRKDKADQEEFDQWAASSDAFRKITWRDASDGTAYAGIVTGTALLGDFVCESSGDGVSGPVPGVVHHVGLYEDAMNDGVDPQSDRPVVVLRAERTESGWLIRKREGAFAGPDRDVSQPELVVGRRDAEGGRFCVRLSDQWLPLSAPVTGGVRLAIIRVLASESGKGNLLPPDPDHHPVYSSHLVHELFEDAPTRWNWVDGAFRMDCRWACQDQWNFMACGSTGLPYLVSKRVFRGDQVHDAFLCLRATFPWDAGDTTFQYSSDADRANKFARLRAANGWYNRHDLNLSFCTDGRNPLSGYAVVFGGEDNAVTRLLRRGVTVAESRRPEHLFPKDPSFMAVHWVWWRLRVQTTGPRVRVFADDRLLFDYTDPEPISGGHLGFWSVRNGFAISRISSMAETIESDPHAFYVATPATPPLLGWQPLVRDTVTLSAESSGDRVRVRNTFGGGFFAVRHTPAEPVDLRATPVLELPLQLGEGCMVSLHLEIGGRPFIVRLGDSPLAGMKALLVPGSEKGECFQLDVIPEAKVRSDHCLAEIPAGEGVVRLNLLKALSEGKGRSVEPVLTCITVGNSSNADYLMAGAGGNAAGCHYSVGRPEFTP